MDLKNDHNVYILGAGFSKEAGLPLINEFLVRMRDSHEWLCSQGRAAEAQAVEKVLEFRLKAASAAYYVHLDLENIEELFSLASASAGEMDAAIRVAISATIDFVRKTCPPEQCHLFVTNSGTENRLFLPPDSSLGHPPRQPSWAKRAGPFNPHNPNRLGPFVITRYGFHVARLLGMFLNGSPQGENAFITFNYDTVLEDALGDLNLGFQYGFGEGYKNPESDPTRLAIPLFKLHGSVNWGINGSSMKNMPKELKIYPDSAALLEDGAQPALVPPTWKKIFAGPLGGVWDAAIKTISTATRIIIIGFSIPPTDMHFQYLMAAGLQNNISLRQITFVNPNQDESRVVSLLRRSYVCFARCRLSEFTACHGEFTRHIDLIGRPVERGLACDLHQSQPV